MRREVRATANRLANFDDANLRRSARAAVAAGARVSAAMDILSGHSSNGSHASGVNGLDGSALEAAPEHLLAAGELRLKHPQASLEELGALADPPMTKDAVAGRIRRLLALADKRAIALGLPTTEAAVSPELLEGA